MEGSSATGFTSPITNKSQAISKSGEANENDEMGSSKSQNPKKQAATKHFMSPTISAASKAAASVPRKKILAESNEDFTFTHTQFHKSPNLDSKTFQSGNRYSYLSAHNIDGDDEQNASDATDLSSLKPYAYDPQTNYLSPRPKFLRYDPNRRNKIFLRRENEIRERRNTSFDTPTAVFDNKSSEETPEYSVPSSHEDSVKEEDRGVESGESEGNKSDDEMEEVDEIEEFDEGKCWSFTGVLNILLVTGALFFSTSYICSMNSPNSYPIQETLWYQKNQSNLYDAITSIKLLEGAREDVQTGLLAANQRDIYDGFEEEEMVEDDDQDTETTVEDSGHLKGTETSDKSESFGDDTIIDAPNALEGKKNIDLNIKDEQVERETQEGSFVEGAGKEVENDKEIVEDGKYTNEQVGIKDDAKPQEGVLGEVAGDEVENGGIEHEKSEGSMDHETELMEILEEEILEEVPQAAIYGVMMILFTSLAAFYVVYRSRQKRNAVEKALPMEKGSSPSSSAAKEKFSPGICSVEKEMTEKMGSFAISSFPQSRKEEASEEDEEFSRHIHAPIVELLGELVIGEATSTLGKSKMLETEDNTINSVSTENVLSRRKAHLDLHNKGQTSQLEISTGDSPSYGSFTSEKKIVKKEEGKGGEVGVEIITTPVRRSSRIRNRGVMSP